MSACWHRGTLSMSEVIRSKRGQAVLISLHTNRQAGGSWCAWPLSGALAQLGEHLLCKQRVIGSIPIGSTKGVALPSRHGRSAHASKGSTGAFCRAGGADSMWVGSSGG
jgi:hypothetical protein